MPTYDVTVEGSVYEVDAPDERTAWAWANQTHRQQKQQAPAPKESTIGSELVRGSKQLFSTSRTGIGALATPEESARAGVERSQQIAAEAGEGPSFAALRKVYEEQGLLPAAGELASQIPRAVAGQLPQLAALAGGAKLGAMAGTAVLPGPGTVVGGVLGAGATLLPQFFGSNVERQAAEQMERGEPVQIDRGTAAAAAAGQAGIEAAGTAFVLGKRVVKGILGITDDAALTTAQAREALVKAAERSRLGAAGRGAGVGLAEIPVEITQAVIERAQAGLDVLSPEALSEYGENAYLAGLVGPTIGAATRVTEPGAARRRLATQEQAEAAEAAKTARETEAAEKATPEYALKLDADYQAAVAKMRELQTAVKQKPAKDADPSQWTEYNQKVAELKEFTNNTMRPLTAEYTPRKAEIAKLKEQQRVEGMTPLEYQMEQAGVDLTEPPKEERVFTGEEDIPTAPAAEAVYAQEKMRLAQQQDIGTFEAKDFAEYLMQDPAMAQRLVDTQTPVPGVSKKESSAILGALKLQLADVKKQERAVTQAELQQRQADLQAQQPQAEVDPIALWKSSVEETEAQADEEILRPNIEAALTPSGPPTIKTPEGIRPLQNPEVLLRRVDELVALRDQAANDADTAFASGNRELGVKKSQEREAAQASLNSLEQTEGPGRALIALRKAQDTALMDAAQLIDDLRVGRTLGGPEAATASSTPQTLINQINRQRDAFVTAAVQEAATTRKLFAKALTQDEATAAAKQMRDVFNEWVTRSMAQPVTAVNWVDKLVAEAQAREAVAGKDLSDAPWVQTMKQDFINAQITEALKQRLGRQRMAEIAKGTAELKGAETELPIDTRRAIESKAAVDFDRLLKTAQEKALAQSTDPRPLEERRFGAYQRAVDVLKEQLQGVSAKLKQVPREFRREAPLLRMQFPETEAAKVAEARGETAKTAEGEMRRRRDYVSGLIDQAFQTRKVPGIAETLLTRAKDFVDNSTGSFLDAAENIASRILRGQNIERSDLVTMRDELRAASMRPGEAEVAGEREGQRELFPAEERRALAPKTVGVNLQGQPSQAGALGTIREKPAAFEAVRQKASAKQARADALVARGEKLTTDIKAELDRIDAERQQMLDERVDARRDALQSAWQSAVKKSKALVVRARATAQKEKLAPLKKEIDAIRAGGIEGLNKPTLDRLLALYKQIDDIKAQFITAVNAAEFLPIAQADKWAAFERGALEQAEKAAAENKTPQSRANLVQQRGALARAEQARLSSMKGEQKAAEAVRMRAAQQGLGLPGVRREAGVVKPIKPAEDAAARAAAEAEQRTEAREAAAERKAARDAELGELEQRVLDLGAQVAERQAAQSRARTPESKARIQEEVDALTKEATLAEAQLAAKQEGKPRKKGPATVVSGAGLARQRPLRTGYRKALEAAEEGMRREREGEPRVAGTLEREERLDSFGVGNKDVFFSRGPTAEPSTTVSVRTELSKAFPDLGRVQIYDSVDALVAANPQYEGRIPSDARGFVDTAGNKAFLIAENINKGDALAVLLHEVGAHIGLKNMLGAPQYNALVKAVETWAKKNDGSAESRVAQAAQERVKAAKTPANQKDDETLAYAIEEAVKAGVTPTQTKTPLGQWLGRIAQAFRKALEKFGLPPKSLDAQGLVDMAFGAAKMEMTPAVPQMSRRQFLRGAGAALGAMKLPPLSKEMKLDALKAAWRASRKAYGAWAKGLSAAVKTPELKEFIFDFDYGFSLAEKANTPALREWLELEELDGLPDYDIQLDNLLSGKDGVAIVADLQQALQAQGKALVDATQKLAKEKGLPEVGELFFGKQVAEKPFSAEFKRWFGDSKVVDAVGKPRVVYHGTGGDFSTFELARSGSASGQVFGKGFYFAADPSTASAYAGEETPSVVPVYISMQNPFVTSRSDFSDAQKAKLRSDKRLGAAFRAAEAEDPEASTWWMLQRAGVISKDRSNYIKDTLTLAGFDGIIAKDEDATERSDETEYVAFRPDQIKSATGNVGAYGQRPITKEEAARFGMTPEQAAAEQAAGNILFSRNLPTASRVADSLIAKEKGWLPKLKENFLGMGARTQFVDKLAPTEEALKRGGTDPTKALQAMYYLRMYDQRMHFTSQSITDGVPELATKTRRDGTTERLIETKPGANIKQIVDVLKRKDVVKAAGSPDAANKLFTLYLAARRAETKGYDKLNFKVSEADIKAARAEIEAEPTLKQAFDEARDIYNQYNRNLLEFAVQTGALSRAEANRLLANNDYIPYYRMRDGVAEMVIGGETPIRIGNLKDSPHLKELVGGDEAIFDFLTSSVQNTSMLLDMATKNLATKNLMFELRDVGLATVSKVPKSGKTPEGAVTFKRDGEDYFAVVDTEVLGIDSDLLVKGLAGIPTMFPSFVRVMGIPARFLRRVVVASPVYMARQLFRDTTAAALTSGANMLPVVSALKQIGQPKALQGRGITGGQVFTGMPEDVTRMLKDMQAGKLSLTKGLAYLEAKSAQADALTREAQYASYIKQGLSEMAATYMSLESMNFSKRGLSPTIHMVSTLIPFFNAQIQGLDVLYKAFTGQMPMNERLAIREKLWTRGLLIAGMSMAYAAAMQDDETYKNAKPEEKYGNWFVQVPGFEQMVRLPIPFELGYVFKALPEALVNIAMNDKGAEEAQKALTHIVQQIIPGGSSYMIPQAVKPALEALAFEKSLYSGRDIESAREKGVEPGYRARESTTELARQVGELTGFSPIKMEYLIRGYTGGMGMALLAALSAPFGSSGPEAATKRASDLPVVGTLFQPNDASGIIDATYERITKIQQVQQTYKKLMEDGRGEDARAYAEQNATDLVAASLAGDFRQAMGEITKFERAIRASSKSPDEKREALERARQLKIRIATSVRSTLDRTKPQAVPA